MIIIYCVHLEELIYSTVLIYNKMQRIFCVWVYRKTIKGIVKWEFFFHKKLGHCTKMDEQKQILGLGAFLGLF